MSGFIILYCWLMLSMAITLIGTTIGSSKLVTVGAVMLLLTAAVSGVS